MAIPPAEWYQLETTTGGMVVHFLPCHEPEWRPSVLGERPLTVDFAGKQVLLEGKAPLWMYAYTAIAARRGGASTIDVFQPQNPPPIRVYPLNGVNPFDPGWLRHRKDTAGGGVLEFQRPPEGELWKPEALGFLPHAVAEWDPDLLTLTGPAPNWLCSAVACLADASPRRLVAYFAPRDGCGILLNAPPGQKVEFPPSPSLAAPDGKKGHVIGILGDPNSGKSVLSILLEKGFQAAGIRSLWRLDCDHASPTPHWYLHMLGQQRKNEAEQLRGSQKRDWTAEAEHSLQSQLRHCVRSLSWVIADFPGGIHEKLPIRRIPPGREVLLRAADAFVILARQDNLESIAMWRDELARHGLAKRVIAEVVSIDHLAPLRLCVEEGEVLRAEADGLHRDNLSAPNLRDCLPPWADLAKAIIRRVEAGRKA